MSWYTGISGLNAASTNLNTIAHNIANASSAGFKNSRAEFGDVIGNGKPGIGVRTEAINQLFGQGSILQTGENGAMGHLDLAIVGDGFFKLTGGPKGDIYTRAGSFQYDSAGAKLVSTSPPGYDLEGAALPAGSKVTEIKADGTFVGTDPTGAVLSGKITLYKFNNPGALNPIGDTAWAATTAAGEPLELGGLNKVSVLPGALEQSNVNLTGELVNMIIAQRDYSANAKTITANDKMTDVTMNISR